MEKRVLEFSVKLVVSHDLDGALVLSEGIVKRHLFRVEPFLFAPLMRGPDVLGELDKLLDNLGRRYGVGVVTGYRLLQSFMDNVIPHLKQ